MIDLRVTNVICSGWLPIKKKLNFRSIIINSKLIWFVATPDYCTPILSTRFLREKAKSNVRKKQKQVYISLWTSGAINMTGLKSLQEGKKYYKIIEKELKRLKM